jgi:uncharacterized protein
MSMAAQLQALQRLPQNILIGIVRAYRLLLSPSLGSSCRFTPSCSVYALKAIEQHGALGGSYLGAARIARCHPWCNGGLDDVPAQVRAPQWFTRLLAARCANSSADISHPSSVSKTLL